MAVLDHPPHEITKRASANPYGCKDRVMQKGYFAPDRITLPNGEFLVTKKFIAHTMSTDCRYDKSLTDQRCAECRHKGSGEKYDQMVRSKGS